MLELTQNERIPADMIVLKSFDDNGRIFIRTDQLDGETDWKLRKTLPFTQKLGRNEDLLDLKAQIIMESPTKQIYEFSGTFAIVLENGKIIREAINLENTIWANTVLASKSCVGIVIYTGKETRAQMNSSTPKSKVGKSDYEINLLNKILFLIMIACAIAIVCIKGFSQDILLNFTTLFRFIVLFSAIVPISLRVNMDIAKALNSWFINSSDLIPETIVRNSTIPEELGRIEYIFTDKTGTLTKNDMVFKKMCMETDQFSSVHYFLFRTIQEI